MRRRTGEQAADVADAKIEAELADAEAASAEVEPSKAEALDMPYWCRRRLARPYSHLILLVAIACFGAWHARNGGGKDDGGKYVTNPEVQAAESAADAEAIAMDEILCAHAMPEAMQAEAAADTEFVT